MIRILDNGIDTQNGRFNAVWCLVEDNGQQYYRASVLRELTALTEDPQNRRTSGEGLLGKQWAAITGLYNAGVNFLYAACGIYQPEHVGVVQLYGAAASAPSRDLAIQKALNDYASVEATLAGYVQSRLQSPDLDIMRWYVEVERGDGSRRKWKNLSALNRGKVALCAADPDGRERLVRDCKAERLNGVATDLRTLVFDGDSPRNLVDISPAEPLWLETW